LAVVNFVAIHLILPTWQKKFNKRHMFGAIKGKSFFIAIKLIKNIKVFDINCRHACVGYSRVFV